MNEIEGFVSDLVKRAGLTEETLHKEAYEDLLLVFYDRLILSLIAMLPQKKQIEIQENMDEDFDAKVFVKYCRDHIDNFDKVIDDIMLDFADEYLKRMGK